EGPAAGAKTTRTPAFDKSPGVEPPRLTRFNAPTVAHRGERDTAGLNILICPGANSRAGCGPARHYLLRAAADQHHAIRGAEHVLNPANGRAGIAAACRDRLAPAEGDGCAGRGGA